MSTHTPPTPRPPRRAPARTSPHPAASLLVSLLAIALFTTAAPGSPNDTRAAEPPPASRFDAGATARALAHPGGRADALRHLLTLGGGSLSDAREAGLGVQVAALLSRADLPFTDHVLAIRAAALLGEPTAIQPLAALLALPAPPPPEAVALAREAARALYQLGASGALAAALTAPDPELRATAAQAGASAEMLCQVLRDDPWPQVRAAAAAGLSQHPAHAPCLATALGDVRQVAAAAVTAAGHSSADTLTEPLRKVAGDARAEPELRGEAVLALARLGDREPAERILRTHRKKGGIVPLALAAVRALAALADPPAVALLRETLADAPDLAVRLLAGQALAELGDPECIEGLRALRPKIPMAARERVDDSLKRLGVVVEDEEPDPAGDPDDDGDEDELDVPGPLLRAAPAP